MDKIMYALVCHDTEMWSSVSIHTTFEKAQSAMDEQFMNEINDAVASGYDEEELKVTSHLCDTTAVVGLGYLPSPYVFAIHEVKVED